MIVTSVARKYIRTIRVRGGELQLRRETESKIKAGRFEPCEHPPLIEAIERFMSHFAGVSPAAHAALIELKEINMDVTTAETKDLVAYYNKHTENQIKKFSDRATAERKVQAILDAKKEKAHVKPKPAPAKQRLEAPATAKLQSTVTVKDGRRETEYRSVLRAFIALGLPENKHKAFRKALKQSGSETFEHDGTKYEFSV